MEIVINEEGRFRKQDGRSTFIVRLGMTNWYSRRLVTIEDDRTDPRRVIKYITDSLDGGSPLGDRFGRGGGT